MFLIDERKCKTFRFKFYARTVVFYDKKMAFDIVSQVYFWQKLRSLITYWQMSLSCLQTLALL